MSAPSHSNRSLAYRCTAALGMLVILCTGLVSAELAYNRDLAMASREHRSAQMDQVHAQLSALIDRYAKK